MSGNDDAQTDCAVATFAVTNARAITGKSLFALVDVEMQIADVCFVIFGVQAHNAPNGCTSVHLLTFRDTNGAWRPTLRLPGELHQPLCDAVLEFLVDEGLARRKYDATASVSRQ